MVGGNPEFRQWVGGNFLKAPASGPTQFLAGTFTKIMSASFLLAGLGLAGGGAGAQSKAGALRQMPENYVHGLPQFYATAMPTQTSAISAGRKVE
jgi:hypothetical protein